MNKPNFPKATEVNKSLQSLGFRPAFIALVGSRARGLSNEDSDFDYKAWVAPSLNDFYLGKRKTARAKIDGYDVPVEVEIKDIRDLGAVLTKQGCNYLDMFCSEDVYFANEFEFIDYYGLFFLAYDPEKAFRACIGMVSNKLKMCEKDLSWKNLIQARYAFGQAMYVVENKEYMTFVDEGTRNLFEKQNILNLEEEYDNFKDEFELFMLEDYEDIKMGLEKQKKDKSTTLKEFELEVRNAVLEIESTLYQIEKYSH